jgi:hypothetical protein
VILIQTIIKFRELKGIQNSFKFPNNNDPSFSAFEGNEKLTIRKLKNSDEKIGFTYMEGTVE